MQFKELSSYFQKLEQTSSRLAITEILGELFRHASEQEIGKLIYLLQGRVAPLYEATEFGMADKFMIRAIALAYGKEIDDVTMAFKKAGDVGKAAEALHNTKAEQATVLSVFSKLLEIAETNGTGSQEKKIALMADLLKKNDALSTRYLARIPLDKLRLGFSDVTILDGLSWMLTGDKSNREALEAAYDVRPDIGYIAEQVKREGMKGLSHIRAHIGSPVLAQLSQRLPTADDMIKKMHDVAVEPKYDGVRIQIHFKRGSFARSFSRNLESTTDMFPELSFLGDELKGDEVILDGEAVGINPKTGAIISFQETTTRKRKHNVNEASQSVPVKFFVFDILYKDGKDLLGLPLSERRVVLEKTVKNGKYLSISPQIITSSADEIRSYHDEQLKKGLEGAMVKKWNSPYEPGRRGYSWVKFKEEEGKEGKLTDTIDAVIMGYYLGEGKRTSFGIGALLVGVKSGDHFVTVTKIGTGVSDELWQTLQKKLHALEVREQPKEYVDVNKIFRPDVWVSPTIVVELAGDDLTKSPTHGAGYAVRFPRLVRIRTDKHPDQITSTREIAHMFSMQGTHKA